MRLTPSGGLRPALALAGLIAAVLLFPVGARAARHDGLPLHVGSSGPRVSALQWLLTGKSPNVFRQVKGTFVGKPTGNFGPKTAAAVYAMKFRLGYPAVYNSKTHPVAGPLLFGLMRGTAHRPARWVAIAASRLRAVNTGPTALAEEMRALEVSWLGIHEEPDGSNRGPRISFSLATRGVFLPAIQSSTGAYGLAWCVSTVQEALKEIGYGTFADDTAGVYSAVDWAAARSLLSAKPKVGAIVAFIDYDSHGHRIPGTGHMGFVVAVQANSFSYIAGNDGNAVREHTIPAGSRPYAFIYLPRLA